MNKPKFLLTLYGIVSVVSMKGLGVGVILLVLAVGQIFSRFVPAAAPVTYAAPPAPAPYPIIYARKAHDHPLPTINSFPLQADPVWLEGNQGNW